MSPTVDATALELNTVGIRSEPDEGPVKNVETMAGGGGGGGGGSPEDASVFVSRDGRFNNDEIDTSFDVTDGGQTFEFTVNIREQGNAFQTQSVTINGDSYDLTNAARDDIINGVDTDLLDARNLQTDQSTLNTYRDDIVTSYEVTNIVHNGNRDLTSIDLRSIE